MFSSSDEVGFLRRSSPLVVVVVTIELKGMGRYLSSDFDSERVRDAHLWRACPFPLVVRASCEEDEQVIVSCWVPPSPLPPKMSSNSERMTHWSALTICWCITREGGVVLVRLLLGVLSK